MSTASSLNSWNGILNLLIIFYLSEVLDVMFNDLFLDKSICKCFLLNPLGDTFSVAAGHFFEAVILEN